MMLQLINNMYSFHTLNMLNFKSKVHTRDLHGNGDDNGYNWQGCLRGQTSWGRGHKTEAKAEYEAQIVCKNITVKL